MAKQTWVSPQSQEKLKFINRENIQLDTANSTILNYLQSWTTNNTFIVNMMANKKLDSSVRNLRLIST